jgi:hypothetical protein
MEGQVRTDGVSDALIAFAGAAGATQAWRRRYGSFNAQHYAGTPRGIQDREFHSRRRRKAFSGQFSWSSGNEKTADHATS